MPSEGLQGSFKLENKEHPEVRFRMEIGIFLMASFEL